LEFRADLQHAAALLSELDRRLAVLLTEYTPTEAGRALVFSPGTVLAIPWDFGAAI